jgi:hypothetical protein
MELTLDYNTELFPLQVDQNVVLALASSLAREPAGSQDTTVDEDRDRDVWRPDGKGRRGFEDEYDYVMYGRVYRFDSGTGEVVYVSRILSFTVYPRLTRAFQNRICIVWRVTHVSHRVLPPHDEHCARGPSISINAEIVTSGGPLYPTMFKKSGAVAKLAYFDLARRSHIRKLCDKDPKACISKNIRIGRASVYIQCRHVV